MYNTNKRIIKEIALEDIKLKIQASFFMLLSNTKMLKDKGCWDIPYKKSNNIEIIENKIFKCVSSLDSFLQSNSKERDQQITNFINLKNELLIIAESIYAYFYYNDHLKSIIANELKILALKESKDVKFNTDNIFNICLGLINEGNLNEEKISSIMSVLPIKMTREKYYDYIKKSLNITFKNGNKNFINSLIKNFKLKFLPNQAPNYGLYYPEIKEKLNTIDTINIEKLDYNGLFEIYEVLTDNLELFSELEDYLSTIYESINYIIYILTFAHDMDFILEENLIYKDIFYSCKNKLNDDLDQEFNSKLDDLISDTCERLVDLIIDIDKSKNQIFDKTTNLPKDTLEVLKINQIITDAYYETLSNAVYPVNLPESPNNDLDYDFIESKVTDFLDYINISLEMLTPKMKRLTKQLFLENLPSPFSIEKFKEYLNYILENSSHYEKILIIESLDSLMHTVNHHNCNCGCHNN